MIVECSLSLQTGCMQLFSQPPSAAVDQKSRQTKWESLSRLPSCVPIAVSELEDVHIVLICTPVSASLRSLPKHNAWHAEEQSCKQVCGGAAPEVENADRAISGDRGEDADAAPRDVVHLPVVRDQLRVHDPFLCRAKATQRRQCLI